jgi:hypothetical protein
VRRQIAEVFDQPGLGKEGRTDGRLEARIVNQCAEVVLIGELKGRVMGIDPGDRQLQCAARIETGTARIAEDERLRADRRFGEIRPAVVEEVEVGSHPLIRPSLSCRPSLRKYRTVWP